ncbi:MAG: amidohydrolase family protein, partial [Pseudomonadota bacterium]
MQDLPLYKIIFADILNPISDQECQLLKNWCLILKKGPLSQGYKIQQLMAQKEALPFFLKKDLHFIELKNQVLVPGLIDLHFHWVQRDVCSAPKDSLLDWLSNYTWPAEEKFTSATYAKKKAKKLAKELIKVGTMGGAAYGSIHSHTVDLALKNFVGDFMVGNVLMTMNSPEKLLQKKDKALREIKELIKKHGPRYVLTPRFAPTTHPQVMRQGSQWARQKKCFVQTHLSENLSEIAYVLNLYRNLPGFEDVESYTEIYHRCKILGPRTLMGHGIHLSEEELSLLSKTRTIIAHCPTSNAPLIDQGLGSGLFDFRRTEKFKVRWGLGSDIGAGPYLSMLDVIQSFVTQNKRQGISQATYTKGLYRATAMNAQLLGLNKSGNFTSGKWANFISLPCPRPRKGERAESLLKRIIAPLAPNREKY